MIDRFGKPLLLGIALTGSTCVCLYLLLRNKDEWDLEESKATSRQVALEMKIPKDVVGSVIGKQGCNIKEIQAKTETRIHFKDELETNEYRVVSIRGLPDDAQMAEILIYKTIFQQPRVESLTIFVPEGVVGRIIGKGGESIKEIKRISNNCRIDVDRGALAEGARRKITLKGSSEQTNMAKQLIDDIVRQDELRNRGRRHPVRSDLNADAPSFTSGQVEGYPSLQMQSICPQNSMEVFVSAIKSPGSFWIRKAGLDADELNKLTSEISTHYTGLNQQKPTKSLCIGDIVATRWENNKQFHRGKILSIKENPIDPFRPLADVLFVDYGHEEEKHMSELHELKTDFLQLPFQAVQCSLANVRPFPGPEWSSDCRVKFEALTHNSQSWARVVCKGASGLPYVELVNVDKIKGFSSIGDELVNQGLAELFIDV